jgi:hypothetical protein
MKKKQIIIPRDRIFISDWEILEEELLKLKKQNEKKKKS